MTNTNIPRLDKTWLYGILLLVVSLFVFFIPIFIHINGDTDGLFAANYLIVIFYFGVICWNHRMSLREQNGLAPHLVFLVLSLVSCYALIARTARRESTLAVATYDPLCYPPVWTSRPPYEWFSSHP